MTQQQNEPGREPDHHPAGTVLSIGSIATTDGAVTGVLVEMDVENVRASAALLDERVVIVPAEALRSRPEGAVTMLASALEHDAQVVGDLRRRIAELEARLVGQPHPSAVPEGWRLVPVEPTPEILDAMRTDPDGSKRDIPDAYLRWVYHAAVSTDPPAPSVWRPMETQSTIADWADGVFGPHQGPVPPLLRSINELVEACIAAGISQQEFRARVDAEFVRQVKKGAAADLTNLPAEVAGTVIVLYRVAQAAGFDLHAAVDAEMRKNRGRQWFAKGDGTGHHLPAPPAPEEEGGR